MKPWHIILSALTLFWLITGALTWSLIV